VTGRVFEVEGGMISVADGWQHGPRVDRGARWEPAEVGAAVRELLARRRPRPRRCTARNDRAHPAPPEVQAEWRALGVWTDETLLDRLAAATATRSRSSTATCA
jgi:hypothetical protein